jgi:hypothetical protein
MPLFEIYRGGKAIASKEFENQFFIVNELDNDVLRWEADGESRSRKGGVIHIWVQSASTTPQISFLRPDWRLTIDGVQLEPRFYEDIDVGGKTIELQYNDYCFVCRFPTIIEAKSDG